MLQVSRWILRRSRRLPFFNVLLVPIMHVDVQVNANGVQLITPMVLLERLQKFKNTLYDIVKDYHQVSEIQLFKI
jgi:hypothetical protein